MKRRRNQSPDAKSRTFYARGIVCAGNSAVDLNLIVGMYNGQNHDYKVEKVTIF